MSSSDRSSDESSQLLSDMAVDTTFDDGTANAGAAASVLVPTSVSEKATSVALTVEVLTMAME